ncbi:MAG: GTPase [Candidatus Dasytiphilus stammeri]
MIPIITLLGRPNVGKSTLFNRMTGRQNVLVAKIPNLTRDRQYGHMTIRDQTFMIVDTGGIDEINKRFSEEDMLYKEIGAQVFQAIEEAHLILLIVDARVGIMPGDIYLTKIVKAKKKILYSSE